MSLLTVYIYKFIKKHKTNETTEEIFAFDINEDIKEECDRRRKWKVEGLRENAECLAKRLVEISPSEVHIYFQKPEKRIAAQWLCKKKRICEMEITPAEEKAYAFILKKIAIPVLVLKCRCK